MSVIGLNQWIAVELLKTDFHNFRNQCQQQLKTLQRQTFRDICVLVAKLGITIDSNDEIASQRRNDSCRFVSSSKQEEESDASKLKLLLEEKTVELQLAEMKNKGYEQQLHSMLEEMRSIKVYIEELKKLRSHKQQSLQTSPVRDLDDEEDQILTKISSLSNLEKINLSGHLDTIKQVTEMSAQSEEEQEQSSQKFEENFSINTLTNQFGNTAIESMSFECVSQVRDMNRLLFENSRQNQQNIPLHETYEESLCILKQFCNNSREISEAAKGEKIDLSCCSKPPALKFKRKINKRHIIYENDYVYTGNAVEVAGEPRPMGFGQLYHNNQLYYCGNWKDGVFDGWGKLYFSKNENVRQFTGQLSHGFPHGPGCMKFWSGEKFLGTFQKGCAQGEGTLIKGPRNKMSGLWQNNILL